MDLNKDLQNDLSQAPGYKTIPQPEGNEGMTFGEQLVGLKFNPSGDDKVARAKQLCAELADLLYDDYRDRAIHLPIASQLFHFAVKDILDAQMNVVKVLTLKY